MSAQHEFEAPGTVAGFTHVGAQMGGGGLKNVIDVLAEIRFERERAKKTYWTYVQYDRFFAAVKGAKDMAHKDDAAGGLHLRYLAARKAGKSEWDFAQSEQRLRDVDIAREARRTEVNKECDVARAQQAAGKPEVRVADLSRYTANASSSYFPPIPAKSGGRFGRSSAQGAAEPTRTLEDDVNDYRARKAALANADDEPEYLPPDPFGDA
jgi:hypothetical protein